MSPSGSTSATAAQDKGRAAPTPSRWSSRRTVIIYAALAGLLSWAWWLPIIILGRTSSVGQGWPTHLPGLLGPGADWSLSTDGVCAGGSAGGRGGGLVAAADDSGTRQVQTQNAVTTIGSSPKASSGE